MLQHNPDLPQFVADEMLAEELADSGSTVNFLHTSIADEHPYGQGINDPACVERSGVTAVMNLATRPVGGTLTGHYLRWQDRSQSTRSNLRPSQPVPPAHVTAELLASFLTSSDQAPWQPRPGISISQVLDGDRAATRAGRSAAGQAPHRVDHPHLRWTRIVLTRSSQCAERRVFARPQPRRQSQLVAGSAVSAVTHGRRERVQVTVGRRRRARSSSRTEALCAGSPAETSTHNSAAACPNNEAVNKGPAKARKRSAHHIRWPHYATFFPDSYMPPGEERGHYGDQSKFPDDAFAKYLVPRSVTFASPGRSCGEAGRHTE